MMIRFTTNEKNTPVGKICDCELHFDETDGILAGTKLIGFSIFERRGGTGRNLVFPSRTYSVNGERRSFALVRPISDGIDRASARVHPLRVRQVRGTAGDRLTCR